MLIPTAAHAQLAASAPPPRLPPPSRPLRSRGRSSSPSPPPPCSPDSFRPASNALPEPFSLDRHLMPMWRTLSVRPRRLNMLVNCRASWRAEADLVQAGRLRNPGFSFGRLRGGDEVEIDRSVMFDLVGLLTLPIAQRHRATGASSRPSCKPLRKRCNWPPIPGAPISTRSRRSRPCTTWNRWRTAAEAGAELRSRMAQAGNWSKLDQAREQPVLCRRHGAESRARATTPPPRANG